MNLFKGFIEWLDDTQYHILIIVALTLGLAPFVPQPHVWEKMLMLMNGTLVKPIDIFDLFMHGAPWVLLMTKLLRDSILKIKS